MLAHGEPQILHAADTAFYMGLIDSQQRIVAMARQLEVAQLARLGEASTPLSCDRGLRSTNGCFASNLWSMAQGGKMTQLNATWGVQTTKAMKAETD